jgi:exosortase/archaeosortase family protein
MIVCTSAHHVMSLIGIANIQSGTALISAPAGSLAAGDKFKIDIADPCSGLHSLLPFLMFSSFYCYFFLSKRWQQWAVFLSTFGFAVVGNIFRIVMLVIGCLLWGSAFAVGTNDKPSAYHEGCGFAVFVVGLGLECLFGHLLVRFTKRSGESSAPASDVNEIIRPPAIPAWRGGTILGFAIVMLVAVLLTPAVYLPKEAGVVMDLPDEVKLSDIDGGHFYGTSAPVSDVEHKLLPKDTEYARKNYDDYHDHSIYFSIVLSGLQQYTIHPPEVCLTAQGWQIIKTQYLPIKLDSGHEITICNLSIQHPVLDNAHGLRVVKAYYMYWYVADNLTTPSHLQRNLVSSWDRIVHNRDHRWAYVIAMSYITDTTQSYGGMNADQTRDLLTAFIRQIVPTFQKSEIPQFTATR